MRFTRALAVAFAANAAALSSCLAITSSLAYTRSDARSRSLDQAFIVHSRYVDLTGSLQAETTRDGTRPFSSTCRQDATAPLGIAGSSCLSPSCPSKFSTYRTLQSRTREVRTRPPSMNSSLIQFVRPATAALRAHALFPSTAYPEDISYAPVLFIVPPLNPQRSTRPPTPTIHPALAHNGIL